MSLLTLLLGASLALAGSGPWVVGNGKASLYVGAESQRITRLAVTVDGNNDVIDVAQGISSFGVKGIATLGITNRVEVEVGIPWWSVRANRTDDPLCDALGLEACEPTQTVGVLTARSKVLLLDEYFGSPLSLSLGGELRYGDFTAPTRARITNAGEGTTDIGPYVSVGRVGSFRGKGYVSGFVESGWRYRFPTTRAFPDADQGDQPAPLPETWVALEALAGPSNRVYFGPVFTFLYRDGLDWGEVDLTDPDRLAALRVLTARLGGSVVVHNGGNLSLVATALQTIAKRNNPNTLSVNLGVSFAGLAPRRE